MSIGNSFTLIKNITVNTPNGTSYNLNDYGLTIGKSSGGLWKDEFIPLISNNSIDNIIGYDGSIHTGQTLKERKIQLSVYYENKTEYELNVIKSILYCRSQSKLITDEKFYRYIWVVSNGTLENNYVNYGELYSGYFEIEYMANDPFFYSVFDSSTVLGYLEDESYPALSYDVGLPYVEDLSPYTYEGITTNSTLTQFNGGNYQSKCMITLEGSGTNIVVTNTTNGQSFTISSMSSEKVVVDGIRGQVRNDTVLKTSLFGGNGDFIKLESGNNTITIQGTNLNLDVSFDFRYTYI